MVSAVTNFGEGKHNWTRDTHAQHWGRVLICCGNAGQTANRIELIPHTTPAVPSRPSLRQHVASPITSALVHYYTIAIRLRALLFFSFAHPTQSPNPCVNEWVSECSDGRIADVTRHVSMRRQDPNSIKSLKPEKRNLLVPVHNRIRCRPVDFVICRTC